MALDRVLGEHSTLFIRSEQLFDMGRSRSLWYLTYPTACCATELMQAGGPRYGFDRLGVSQRGAPQHCDVMIVAGTVNLKAADALSALYEQMPEPKWVIAMGACACTGGPFRGYPNVVLGAHEIVPVDVYIPGCPPRPESVQHGFTELRKKIAAQTGRRLETARAYREGATS